MNMLLEFQNLFISPTTKNPLSFKGTLTPDKRWREGVLENSQNKAKFHVKNGIPNFVERKKEAWTGGVESLNPELEWIKRSWNNHFETLKKHKNHDYYEFARKIAKTGGLGIDIASGPGGGSVPSILFFNPKAKIMMTDLGVSVLYLWQEFLHNQRKGHDVAFTGMDVTRIPLKSNCLDYVVDSGGFGNVEYADKAIGESFRVLKSGGKLYLNDAITEDVEKLPAEVYSELVSKKPQYTTGWEQMVKEAGFIIESKDTWKQQKLNYDESDLGALSKQYGVEIYFTSFSLIAHKP